jgi:hypothetical protein
MTDEVDEAKDAGTCSESDMNTTSLDLQALAHRTLYFVE